MMKNMINFASVSLSFVCLFGMLLLCNRQTKMPEPPVFYPPIIIMPNNGN